MACFGVAGLRMAGSRVRTPVRKALLAGAVTKETYGRAFGFERMRDTLGAVVGPASAFFLLQAVNPHYPTLFALTLIPGLLAAGLIAFAVKEKERKPVPHTLPISRSDKFDHCRARFDFHRPLGFWAPNLHVLCTTRNVLLDFARKHAEF
jgi:MFS family permease